MADLNVDTKTRVIHATQGLLNEGSAVRVDGALISDPRELLNAMIRDPDCDDSIAAAIASELEAIRQTIEFSKFDTSHKHMNARVRVDLSGQAAQWVDFEWF